MFLEAVYQLKKTSDCIQIHPPRKKMGEKKTENFDEYFSLRLAACLRRFFSGKKSF